MTDTSFRRFAGACSVALAVSAVLYALLLATDSASVELLERAQEVLSSRGLNQPANLLLGIMGLLTMAAVMGVHDGLRRAAPAWMSWAAVCGAVGGAMTAAHGFWDFTRIPVLMTQWESGNRVRQTAIATFAGVPNPVDPKGLGAFVLVGLFALVAARTWSARGMSPSAAGPLGLMYGLLSIVLFVAGFTALDPGRAILAGITIGVVGPLWWVLIGWGLWSHGGSPPEPS